jgi:hypothetical protein
MRARSLTPALLGLLLLASCSSPSSSDSKGNSTTSTAAALPPSTTTTSTTFSITTTTTSAQLPDLIGNGLQVAHNGAQAAGVFVLSSHDATGRGRHQILDTSWKVCFQQPAAGLLPTTTDVDFCVVELTQVCPTIDLGMTPSSASGTPSSVTLDLVGKSVNVATAALGADASVTFVDVTGHHRSVFA